MRPNAALAAALLTLSASGAAAAATPLACLDLPTARTAMQVYSVRSQFMTGQSLDRAALDRTLAGLSAIGWRNVEPFGGGWGLSDADLKTLYASHHIQPVAAHETLDMANWDQVLTRAKALGQTYVGSGNYGKPGLDTLDHVLETAANLNKLGEAAARRGLKFYVHNHTPEFKNRFDYDLNGDGKAENVSAWEIVEAKTDPRFVNFEIDVHWARVAMGVANQDDLLAFLKKHRNRIVLLHMKDTQPDGQMADLGAGITEWKRVVDAAGPQIGYYIWEYDNPPQPMESAKVGYQYLTCGRR